MGQVLPTTKYTRLTSQRQAAAPPDKNLTCVTPIKNVWGISFLQDMQHFACWHYLNYVKGRVERQLKALGHLQNKSDIMDLSLEKKPTKPPPVDFRNRGSLGKDSPGQLPSQVNPCMSPAPLPQVKYLRLHSEVMYELKQHKSRIYVLTDINLCMKPQVPHKVAAYSLKRLSGEAGQTSGRIIFYQLKFF